ncbi:MAG TPA: hypothetical protein VFR43_08620 [Gaiellaceae bacterium]|nr:hypothetical protein [Gaiellaceae bacterium]
MSVQAGNAAGSGTEVSAATGTVTRRPAREPAAEDPAVYSRSWRPAPRFRGAGRFVVTLRARDKSGRTSLPDRRVLSA